MAKAAEAAADEQQVDVLTGARSNATVAESMDTSKGIAEATGKTLIKGYSSREEAVDSKAIPRASTAGMAVEDAAATAIGSP